MTRSSKLALVTLLAGLLSLASVGTVSAEDQAGGGSVTVTVVNADSSCTGFAREHCEEMAAAKDASFRVTAVASPVHILSATGMGREHFEAMSVTQPDLFVIAPDGPAATYLPTYAPEHFEEVMAGAASN